MPFDKADVLRHIDRTLHEVDLQRSRAGSIAQPREWRQYEKSWSEVAWWYKLNETERETVAMLYAMLVETIDRYAPPGTTYPERLREATGYGIHDYDLPVLVGILQSLRADVNDDFLHRLDAKIREATLERVLDRSKASLDSTDEGKRVAATGAGLVLEAHLLALAERHSVTTLTAKGQPVAASTLNDQVQEHYQTPATHDLVAYWLKIRNEYSHPPRRSSSRNQGSRSKGITSTLSYPSYSDSDIDAMITGISRFVAANPA